MEDEQEQMVERFFSSGLKLDHLRILVSLADLKQVKRVAEAFHVSQPAISKRIAEMERALGVDLVKRAGQRIGFTPFGHALTTRAREVLHQLHCARKDFDTLLSGKAGSLSLGVVTTVTPVLIPEAVTAFRQRAPNVSLALTEGTADQLLPRLEHGELDLVVGRTAAPSGHPVLRGVAIAHDPLVIVVSRQHPLASRMAPDWQDLKGSQWIVPSPASPVYQALVALLQKHGLDLPAGCVQSVSLIANIGLISRSSLIGLLPKTLAVRHVADGSLFIVPLDISSILGRVHVLWHADRPSPTVSLMRECLEYCGRVYGSSGRV